MACRHRGPLRGAPRKPACRFFVGIVCSCLLLLNSFASGVYLPSGARNSEALLRPAFLKREGPPLGLFRGVFSTVLGGTPFIASAAEGPRLWRPCGGHLGGVPSPFGAPATFEISSCCSAASRPGHITGLQQQQQHQQQREQPAEFATASLLPLGLLPSVRDSLLRWGVSAGSSIQAAALPLLLQGLSVCMAGETGSGKSLAYIVALVQRVVVLQQLQQLQQQQQQQQQQQKRAAGGRYPLAVVLVPSRELALQLLGWARRLLQGIPSVSHSAVGLLLGSSSSWPYAAGDRSDRQLSCPSLLISTPHAFAAAARREKGVFAAAETLVLDEADMLLDGGYEKHTVSLLEAFRAADRDSRKRGLPPTQYILAAATLPSGGPSEGPLSGTAASGGAPAEASYRGPCGGPRGGLWGALRKRFPAMRFVESPLLHRHCKGLQQQFVAVSAKETEEARIDRLLEALRGPLRGLKTLVFCNTAATARRVCQGLQQRLQHQQQQHKQQQHQQQQQVSLFSSELPPLSRAKALKHFSGGAAATAAAAAAEAEAEAAGVPAAAAGSGASAREKAATADLAAETATKPAAAAAAAPAGGGGMGKVLVCTDAAARGLHVEGLGAVVQFDFASSAVSHLHRVGRVARAGASGRALSFFLPQQQPLVDAIRGLTHKQQQQPQQQQQQQLLLQQQGWQNAAEEDHSLAAAFSRKRSFAKRLKKKAAAAAAAAATATGSAAAAGGRMTGTSAPCDAEATNG